MKELDLDATLKQANTDPIDIKLVDKDLFPEGSPILQVQITWQDYQREQRKRTDIYVKPGKDQHQEESEIHVARDPYQLGLCLTQYVVGWEGIAGEFSREKLYQWFEAIPDACIAFANGLEGVLKQRQQHMLQYRETTKKNS